MATDLERRQIRNLAALVFLLGMSLLAISYVSPKILLSVTGGVLDLDLNRQKETSVLSRLVFAQKVFFWFGICLIVTSSVLMILKNRLPSIGPDALYRVIVILGLGAPVVAWILYQLSRYGINFYSGISEFRASHWVITYQDYGFLKRSLPGSILRLVVGDEGGDYKTVVIASSVVLVTLMCFMVRYFWLALQPKENRHNLLLVLVFVSSPVTLLFFANDNGRFDHINYLILLSSMMLITYKIPTTGLAFGVGLLSCVGLLTHEAFVLFQFPFLVALCLDRFVYREPKQGISRRIINMGLIILPVVSVGVMLSTLGYVDNIPMAQFELLGEEYANFRVAPGYIGTFFMVPWERPPFYVFGSYFSVSDKGSPPIAMMTFLVGALPMVSLLAILWKNVFRSLTEAKTRISVLLIFSACFVPMVVPLYGGFIDNYRQYSGSLIMLVLGYLYLVGVGNSHTIRNTAQSFWPELCLIGVLYNLVIYLWAGPLRDHIFPGLAEVLYRIVA